jgi:ATP-binding cassette subfamily B protein
VTTPQDEPPLFRPAAVDARRPGNATGDPVRAPDRVRPRPLLAALKEHLVRQWRVRPRLSRLAFYPQVESHDCGASCLATVFAMYDRPVDPGVLRDELNRGVGHVSARQLLECARRRGFVARGVRLEADALRLLPRGAILHWRLEHFVVLDRVTRRGAEVVDPALGRRTMSFDAVDANFTGIALVVEDPGDAPEAPPVRRVRPWSYVAPLVREPRLWTAIALCALLSQAIALSYPVAIGYVVDKVIAQERADLLRTVAVAVIPVFVFQLLLLSVRVVALSWVRARVDYRLTLRLVTHLMSLPYSYFERRTSGDLLMRIRSTAVLRQIFTASLMSAVVDGATSLTLFAVLVWIDVRFALAALVLVCLQGAVVASVWTTQRDLAAAALEAQANSEGRLVQVLTGAQTLKLAGAETDVVSGWTRLLADETNTELQRSLSAGTVEAVVGALRLGAPFALLALGTGRVLSGGLATGTMLAAISVSVSIFLPVSTMLGSLTELAAVSAYLARINDLLGTAPEREVRDSPTLTAGAVRLRDVTFSYYDETAAVLRGADLTLDAGRSLAILGRSGTGKSTTAKIIAALYAPQSGTVTLDGIPATSFSLRHLRQQIGYVPQEPYFFSGSVRDNITLFRDSDDADVLAAARVAGVGGPAFPLEHGLDTVVSEGAASLSGGQRQRVGIARALLHRPRLLILDEATSALDPESEAEVLADVLALGLTTIFVTHRPSVARQADQVVHLENGRFTEAVPADAE